MNHYNKLIKPLKVLAEAVNKYADALPEPEFPKGGIDFAIAGEDKTEYVIVKGGKIEEIPICKKAKENLNNLYKQHGEKFKLDNMKLKDLEKMLNKDRHISDLSEKELLEIREKISVELEKRNTQEEKNQLIDYYAKMLKSPSIPYHHVEAILMELKDKLYRYK